MKWTLAKCSPGSIWMLGSFHIHHYWLVGWLNHNTTAYFLLLTAPYYLQMHFKSHLPRELTWAAVCFIFTTWEVLSKGSSSLQWNSLSPSLPSSSDFYLLLQTPTLPTSFSSPPTPPSLHSSIIQQPLNLSTCCLFNYCTRLGCITAW